MAIFYPYANSRSRAFLARRIISVLHIRKYPMKTKLTPRPILSPQMIQMIATYNEDGSVDLMNAAWGGQLTENVFVLSLDETHKTVANIRREGAFTLGLPSRKDIVDCDYVGMVSGNVDPNKFAKTNLHASPSQILHAPVIEEFPLTFECKVLRLIEDEELGFYVLGEVQDILVSEEYVGASGAFDVEKMDLCFFSPLDHTYRAYGPIVAKAFSAGKERKK